MRMHRAALLSGFVFTLALSSVGCESPSCCRAPRPQYIGGQTYPPAYPQSTSPPVIIPENPGAPPTALPAPTPMPPGKLPTSFGGAPTITPPVSDGPLLSPPSKVGPNSKALSASKEPPVRLGEPEFPKPPVTVEILGFYGIDRATGKPVPAYDEQGRPLPIPGQPAPGVIPVPPPSSDLPPHPETTPETKPQPKPAVPFRPDRTA